MKEIFPKKLGYAAAGTFFILATLSGAEKVGSTESLSHSRDVLATSNENAADQFILGEFKKIGYDLENGNDPTSHILDITRLLEDHSLPDGILKLNIKINYSNGSGYLSNYQSGHKSLRMGQRQDRAFITDYSFYYVSVNSDFKNFVYADPVTVTRDRTIKYNYKLESFTALDLMTFCEGNNTSCVNDVFIRQSRTLKSDPIHGKVESSSQLDDNSVVRPLDRKIFDEANKQLP